MKVYTDSQIDGITSDMISTYCVSAYVNGNCITFDGASFTEDEMKTLTGLLSGRGYSFSFIL